MLTVKGLLRFVKQGEKKSGKKWYLYSVDEDGFNSVRFFSNENLEEFVDTVDEFPIRAIPTYSNDGKPSITFQYVG